MNGRNLLIGVLVLALAVGLFLVFGGGGPLVKDTVKLYRVTLNGEPTPNGFFSVEYNRDSDEYPFINIAIDFNKDGSFETYTTEDGTEQAEWVVENMGAKVLVDEGNTFSIPMPDSSIDQRADFPAVLVMTRSALEGWDGSVEVSEESLEFVIDEVRQDEIGDLYSPDPTGVRSGGFPNTLHKSVLAQAGEPDRSGSENLTGSDVRTGEGDGADGGAEGGDGDGDGGDDAPIDQFHSGVPDIDQGKNECVPTATANSLLWLAQVNDFEDKMPDSSEDLIGELKKDFKWNEHGVDVKKHYIPGKKKFQERRDIPIETHQVGEAFDENIVQKIANELAKGQDVEVDIEYGEFDEDGDYDRVGGHMVTVVGAWSAGGSEFLGFHDPVSTESGKLDIYKITDDRMWNYRYRGDSRTYIRYAIAESPIKEEGDAAGVAPDEEGEEEATAPGGEVEEEVDVEDIPTADSLTDIEQDNLNNTWFLKMLEIDGDFYPIRQFIVADPDACDADHYHHRSEAYGLHFEDLDYGRLNSPQYVREREAEVVSKRDPNPNECGFGKVNEVPTETMLISRSEAVMLLGEMFP